MRPETIVSIDAIRAEVAAAPLIGRHRANGAADDDAHAGTRAARDTPSAKGIALVPLPYVWADQLGDLKPRSQLIEGLVLRESLVVVIGASGSGKSTVVIGTFGSVVRGVSFLGRRTRRGICIYLACEGPASVKDRLRAYQQHHNTEELAIAVVQVPVSLLHDPRDVERIVRMVRMIETETGEEIVAIAVDTLARSFGGGDENSSQDMSVYIQNVSTIVAETRATVFVVHHFGKDQNRGPRGSNALFAGADTVLEVANDGGVITIKSAKQRDLAIGDELTARLRPIALGIDEWGNKISACIVEATDGKPTATRARKLPAGTDLALHALRETVSDYGQPMPGTSAVPPGAHAVSGERWRARYFSVDSIDVDTSDSEVVGKAKDARVKRFTRARKALQDANIVGGVNDLWWIYS